MVLNDGGLIQGWQYRYVGSTLGILYATIQQRSVRVQRLAINNVTTRSTSHLPIILQPSPSPLATLD